MGNKSLGGIGMAGLMLAMLAAVDYLMGPRVALVAAGFATLWFAIAFVLLSRPPGIPEFVSERPGGDEQYVIRRDLLPRLPLHERLRLALTVACGSCLVFSLTLGLLGR